MNDYSSLFTSGLMLLCDSRPRSRQLSAHTSPTDPKNMRSFLSLDMAESLRTFTASSGSSTRSHSRKPSAERRSRAATSSVASSSKLAPRPKHVVSPAGRRRSLPQPKPAPLSELPLLPTNATHSRSRSDSAASQAFTAFSVVAPSYSDSDLPSSAKASVRRSHLAPSSLKLELSTAPTTPCSPFPTTPRSSRAVSMFSPLTPPAVDAPWFCTEPSSPCDTWSDAFAAALSPTTTESALGLHLPHIVPAIDLENVAPRLDQRTLLPKRARARRDRHSAPSRNTSIAANSMRSSQGSVTTSYRRTQRNGALARLEGRVPRSEWMSDDEEAPSTKYKPSLSLIPSMDFKAQPTIPLARFRVEDQNSSFIDLSDDASIAARRRVSSFAT